MSAKSPVYDELNKKWKATCRILLGGEVGELSEFSEWLYERNGPRTGYKSSRSGKTVVSYDGRYSKGAKWLSLDEVNFSEKKPLLDINQVKDLDSIADGISGSICYAGNMELGNSTYLEDSTTVMDSHFVLGSESVWSSKYIAYTTHVIGECVFGGNCVSSNFLIRCACFLSERCFEVSKLDHSSGIYYSHGLSACHDCMFSFNLRGKRYRIGNLELPKDKYASLKAKIVGEMREKLKKDKRLPHLADLFSSQKPDYAPMKAAYSKMPAPPAEKQDKSVIENAFTETCKLMFGVPYSGLSKYENWLMRNTRKFEESKSCASAKKILIPIWGDFLYLPRDRMLSLDEAEFIGGRVALPEEEIGVLSLSNAPKLLSKIAYFSPELKSGNNANNTDCPIELDCTDCLHSAINIGSKRCAFGWWPRNSAHLFGFNRTRLSAFCINCFDSEKLQRCFEVSEGRGSSDCYYCHNIENCHDCMFCFNSKNLRYAVGNVELPKEKYLEIKKKILAQLNEELQRTNSISLSIFNLPDAAKTKRRA
jgi:hypothetical protein